MTYTHTVKTAVLIQKSFSKPPNTLAEATHARTMALKNKRNLNPTDFGVLQLCVMTH